jgi:hypothetical protein
MDCGFYDYGEGITAIDACYERPRLNAMHVVIERGRAAVIDTGTAHSVVLTHGGRATSPTRAVSCRRRWRSTAPRRGAGSTARCPRWRPNGSWKRPRARASRSPRDARTGHLFAEDSFGLSYRELDLDGRQFSFHTTSPSQCDPPALHRSIERMVPRAAGDLRHSFRAAHRLGRLAADLHRLIDAHAQRGREHAAAGARRHAALTRGVREILRAEALRQGRILSESAVMEVFKLDIELNAQGLEAWLDSHSAARAERFPSEKR